jgi:hypothetical protein
MTISLNVEIPESLHAGLKAYLENHPGKDQDGTIGAGLALFLMQNSNDNNAARHYLNSLFGEVAA